MFALNVGWLERGAQELTFLNDNNNSTSWSMAPISGNVVPNEWGAAVMSKKLRPVDQGMGLAE